MCRGTDSLSTVGFLGQIVTFVGAGEGWSGVRTLASPMGGRRERGAVEWGRLRRPWGTGRRATQGSPPFLPATPAPTRRSGFPARFTKYLPLRAGEEKSGVGTLASFPG